MNAATPSADARLFWERAETVARFAAREPDLRLVALCAGFGTPSRTRALDLGCAAGRNTVLLAARGFPVLAVDASEAMVRATRERLAALGLDRPGVEVRTGRMDRLDDVPDGSLDLVVALGVYHQAAHRAEWDAALSETRRVLARGGLALVASHAPGTRYEGDEAHPVPGEPHVFEGYSAGRAFLVDAPEMDREMARHGLMPLTPTATSVVESEDSRRITVNALYIRR
jgi:SAM-dependent methyltransferase